VLFVGAAASVTLAVLGALALDRGDQRATSATALSVSLGPRMADASLVRRPSRAVRVQLRRDGYSVSVAGHGTVALARPTRGDTWSRFVNGVSRETSFGHETITVRPDRTEEFLTVSRRQGAKTWRWRLQAGALRPRFGVDGSISFTGDRAPAPLKIAPARILDEHGEAVTPRGVRWSLRRATHHSWWLELRLDDARLPVPYVIDPAVDYPTPLYLSSTTSSDNGSWRLVTSAPSVANTATKTIPASGATGYYIFKPGVQNTASGTPSTTPTGTGWLQDLAGGTGFPAGTWSFTIKTQIPSANLVAGTAILAIGIWKGTINNNGTFKSKQTILAPTDDPAAQNIRSATSRTTTVTLSVPAFTLASTERLYVDVWRKQVGGISSGTASEREVDLVANDGGSQIAHPPADDTLPVNAFSVATSTGGVYFTNPGGATGTVYYRGSVAGSFRLADAATDSGSGVQQVSYPAVTTAGWTHPADAITTGPAYTSSTYSWTAGATTSPGAQAIAAQDNALNTSTGSPVTITNDTTAPTTPSVALTSPPAWYTTASVALTPTDGTDAASGLDLSSRVYQRDEAPLNAGTCGTFPNTWSATVSNPDTTVQSGKCYRYRLLESDRVGNQSAPSAASASAKVDLQGPTQPSLAFTGTSASATGSTVYYRSSVSGSFTVTASGSTDAASGLSAYVFPTPASWTVTGTGASRTYAWTPASTQPGTLGVHGVDVAGNSGSDASFTPTPDTSPPTTTDNTATIGSGWKTSAQTVTLAATDALSGVATTYYTTDGSTPTTSSPQGTSITLATDGVYTIRYFSVDKVGNAESVSTASTQIRVDVTAPTVTMGTLPAAIHSGQTLTASASDGASGIAAVDYYYCTPSPCAPATLIGSSSTGPGYSFTWTTQPPDGTYDILARATDNAGNGTDSAKQSVQIANTPPDTTITIHPPDPSNDPAPIFWFTSTDPTATFECKLDAAAYAACTSPTTLNGLADGSHTFSVRSVNAAGPDPTPATWAWTKDTVAPDTSITSHPTDPSTSSSASFSFTSTESGSSFECKLDAGAYAACTSPTAFTGLADGSHTFSVRATDTAGNTDATPATFTWSLDSGPPDTTITSQPTNPSSSSSASFSFTSTEAGSTFQCKLDAGTFATCTSPNALTSLADGSHTFSVRAIDAFGNVDPTPASSTWTVDTAPPDTTITSQPTNPSTSTSAAYSFTSSETGSSFQCKLDAGAFAACTSPTTLTGLLDGPHTFSVKATDAAGNADPTPATFTWIVDTGPPDTTITSQPTNPSAEQGPSFSFTSSEAGSTFQCKLDAGTFATCTSPNALTGLADGSHTFSVRAVDAVGNLDPSPASYTWTVDTTPPDTTITAQPPTPSAVSTATFSFTSTEGGSSFQCQLDGATYVSCSSPQDYSALANGTHTFAVRATDSLGNTDATPALYSWTVNVPFVPVDEVHYTFTGPTSVAFDWRGTATDIRYGPSAAYGSTATAHTPSPLPFSSAGPFREVDLTGLAAGTTYHYSIGGGSDETFTTAPTGSFTFDVIADVGATSHYPDAPTVHSQVASDDPAFVLVPGDLTYADPNGQSVVDEHFNDVMTWSRRAAYMPAWGNHEWQTPTSDDLRNYKGRFAIPNAGTSPDAPSAGCCGEDWGWFDAGPVRFIAYPEKYTNATWSSWQTQVDPIFAAAQSNPSIQFIVTFGHRPAYSTGLHGGETQLANILDTFGSRYSKYVLNINGHSHDYERYQPISGVTHITTGGATSLEAPWVSGDARTAVRAMHLEHLRIAVSSTGMRIDAICGPASPFDDITCDQGSELDSYTIGTNPPPPPTLPPVLYVDNSNPFCSNTGIGSATQPYCTIGAAATRVGPGQTVEVGGTTYPEMVNVVRSGSATARIVFRAAPGTTPTVTGGTNGFLVSGQSYVTIDGFGVTQTTGDGILVKNATNVLVTGNHVFSNGQPVLNQTARGIRFETVTNSVVEQNTVDHNTAYGIYIDVSSTDNLVHGNNCFANAFGYQRAASGIRIHTSTQNTISSNWTHDNEDSGIDLDKATDNLVVDNVINNNGDHGIDVTAQSFRTTVTGNTVYKSVTAGINVEGTSTATIANNVSVDNGIASPRTHSDIRVDIGSTDGTTLDYDQVFLSSPDLLLIWGASSYTSLPSFQAATGQETHGLQATARFNNAAGADFHLTTGSAAIDSANSNAAGQPAVDGEGYGRVNDPVTVDTGVGVRTYDDRGALEYHAPVLDHVQVNPANATLTAGGSLSFTAEGYDAANNDIGNVTGSTSFSIAPDGSCTGTTCTATTAGPHTVSASVAGVTGSTGLTVSPGALHHLVLAPASATIIARGSITYTADGRDQYNNSIGDVTATTTFTISPNGSCTAATCTASSAGAHTVTGTKAGKTATASLQVLAGTSHHIVISPAAATITAGGTRAYTAQSFDSSGNVIGDVTSSTSFSISPDGSCSANVCTASAAGPHTVTGIYSGQTSTASLTVTAGALDHLALTPATATITAGGAQAYSAQGRDQYDNPLGDMTSGATFTIAPDGSCSGATCTATLAGPHTVSASAGAAGGSAALQVTASAVIARVVISPSTATVAAGAAQAYTAQGYDAADNPIGDVTAATSFAIGPDGSCAGNSCTATSAGAHTVTGTAGSASDSATLTVAAGGLDHILLSPASATISAGGSQTYSAEGRDQYNNSLGDISQDVTFAIAPNGSCTDATCTASSAGAHTVTASEFGKTGSASLQVTSGTLDHIVINPASDTITAGETQTYAVEGFDTDGNSLGDFTLATTFTIAPDGSCSGNTCTATVVGQHTVTAINNGKTSSAVLTANAGALDHLVLAPASATIVPGGTQSYIAYGRDQYDNWLGDQTAITTFTIAPDGSCTGATCTAAVNGAHTVTATVGEITGTAALQVTPAAAIDHIVISPGSATIAAGDTQTYSAEAFDASNNSLGDITGSTSFTIAPNGSCTANVCTATTAGAHTVTGTGVGKTSTAALSVTPAPLDHLVLAPATAVVAPGAPQTYTAVGRDQYDNSLGDITGNTTFTIAPDGSCVVATCTASVDGAHTVTGTSVGATGTATLTVSSAAMDHIVISPASASITAGGSRSYTAEAFDASNNSLGDVTGSTTFTIAPNGSCSGATCTATVSGVHTVTGSSGGKSSDATLTVTAGPLHHLALSPASATIGSGGSQTYTAQGRDQYDNSLGDVTAGTTFTIAPNGSCSSATCTAITSGAHTVTGTNAGKTGTATLQVTTGTLDHIVISPATATITAGGSRAYTAQGFDASNNSLGDVTPSTTFTIGPNGSCTGATCTATAAGTHTVTGTNAGKTSTATLTVDAGPLDHLALSPGNATITAGGSQAYTAQGRDQFNNSLGDVTPGTTFTIGPNGSCTGATCTATTAGAHTVTGTNGGKTGTASLQINGGALDHLVLSPASATIIAGTSQTYTADGRDQFNNSLGNVTSNTTFTISPDGSCTGATCTATNGGPHTVTGTDAGKTGTASLTVDAASVDHIVISPATASITAGGSRSYTAEAFDASNNSLGDVTGTTTFTIAPDGSCTGSSCTATTAGTHTVTGTNAGKTSNATLTVTAGPLHHLALSPASATISPGGSQTYTAQGRDQFDNSLGDVTAGTTFAITPNGSCAGATCTATTSGAHTVTGTNSGKTGTASLQVASGTLDHIVISPATATITAGGSRTYTAQGFDASNNSLGDVTASTTFTILPDGSCTGATCTATAAGMHTVTGNDAGKTSSASLTVNAGPLDHLALSPASATIASGGSQAYTAQGRDQYNNPLGDLTSSTTFTIAPDGSCAAAVCSATTAGAHTVTGTAVGATGTASLQVGAGSLDHITISPATATIASGGSQAYTAQGFDAANNLIGDVTANTTFTISPDGSCTGATCTAINGGTHTVTGTDAGKTATARLSVSYVKNPGFETNLTGWNTSGSGANVTLTRVAGGHSGGWAAVLTNTGSTNASFATLQDSPNWVTTTSPGPYTGTIWVRADTAGAVFKLKFQEFNGSTLVGSASAQATLTTSWQQVTVTYTITSPGSTLDFQAFVQNATPGAVFYADDASIVLG
jgi:parallel beta-helix repeat protein